MSSLSSINASASLVAEGAFHEPGQDHGDLKASGDVVDYRDGDDSGLALRSLPHDADVSDVTLKRGLVSTSSLSAWLSQVRNGAPHPQTGWGLQNRLEILPKP